MKQKILYSFIAMLLVLPAMVKAGSPSPFAGNYSNIFISQSTSDTTDLLQKCIDLPQLQQYLKNADGTYKPLVIMEHAVSFSSNLPISYPGNSVNFLDKRAIKTGNYDSHFYFHKFNIEQDAASIDYVYNYDQLSGTPKMQVISLQLQKTAGVWNITQTKMEGR